MTVRELVAQLLERDMNAEVIMSRDAEGDNYSPAYEIVSGRYRPDNTWSGEFTPTTPANIHSGLGTPAVAIYPVN